MTYKLGAWNPYQLTKLKPLGSDQQARIPGWILPMSPEGRCLACWPLWGSQGSDAAFTEHLQILGPKWRMKWMGPQKWWVAMLIFFLPAKWTLFWTVSFPKIKENKLNSLLFLLCPEHLITSSLGEEGLPTLGEKMWWLECAICSPTCFQLWHRRQRGGLHLSLFIYHETRTPSPRRCPASAWSSTYLPY